jgi:hypothetical protein
MDIGASSNTAGSSETALYHQYKKALHNNTPIQRTGSKLTEFLLPVVPALTVFRP